MAKVTQEQIFEAARSVLNQKGYDKARLADVARRLDITSAALYKHFKNKEDLFEATVIDWLRAIDRPVFETDDRAPEDERGTRLHDWLWLLAENRHAAFVAEPELTKLYKEYLESHHELLNQRLVAFSESVESIMAWETFRHQRGLTVMQTFIMFYHPLFVNMWEDPLLKTLFESTWLEIQPIVQPKIEEN
ncbi:TetR/AcrR family transcriptional regulator [Weissella minor]|uniref:TetR/AcrR family transcriptional regulator n=1 Tax=Weissella minor TaxID=1620 RepID=UPI001BAFBDAB|nr:TetR/AcrR family transcriptional regulator [Weissella minor]MBS0948813.1 TetR/AcrR family transcriptional regulator [Weissella minor]